MLLLLLKSLEICFRSQLLWSQSDIWWFQTLSLFLFLFLTNWLLELMNLSFISIMELGFFWCFLEWQDFWKWWEIMEKYIWTQLLVILIIWIFVRKEPKRPSSIGNWSVKWSANWEVRFTTKKRWQVLRSISYIESTWLSKLNIFKMSSNKDPPIVEVTSNSYKSSKMRNNWSSRKRISKYTQICWLSWVLKTLSSVF